MMLPLLSQFFFLWWFYYCSRALTQGQAIKILNTHGTFHILYILAEEGLTEGLLRVNDLHLFLPYNITT